MEEKALARAKNAAFRFLTYRPRSRSELQEKLRKKAFSEDIITIVIDICARLGYIDDTQFTLQWTLSRIRLRGFGRRRIEVELRNKGIDREIIREVLTQVFSEGKELETAKLVAEKKISAMKSVDRVTLRKRLAGFLERKGFSFEIIRTVLRDTDKS